MKHMRYLLVLAIGLFAIASVSNAQTVQFLGGGSSALFLELGQAAVSSTATATPCVWTQGKTAAILARDTRTSTPTDEQGNVWITWSKGAGADCEHPANPGVNIYSYMQLDSVVGDKCFFMVDSGGVSGCTQVNTVATTVLGASLLCPLVGSCGVFADSTTFLPTLISGALNSQRYFVIGTDIRPEDAKWASLRMFTPCNQTLYRFPYNQTQYQTFGLGYQTGTTGVGTIIHSDLSTATFNVLDFNITGNDPITSQPVRTTYNVSTVGAQPIIVIASPSPASPTGLSAASDINGFTLTLFMQGVLGRATDLVGPTVANPVTVLVREPLSGTYNTMEASVPMSSQFKAGQDYNNCNSTTGVVNSNPMHIASANGQVTGAVRRRVIGTKEMFTTLQAATTDTLGYVFWSAANTNGFTATNGKYLSVNGVDPLKDAYTDGVIPTAAAGTLGTVTFKWLNQGDYQIWSAVRLVSTSPTPAGVTALITGAQTVNTTTHDFIPLATLNVVHSHFYISALGETVEANGDTLNPATPGDLCPTTGALVETGADAGGTNVVKQANADFCKDYSVPAGLINKNN
jgi:hypothetical protein